MSRVLHVGKYFPPQAGGMETYLADLLAAQRAQGLEAAALVHGEPLPDDPPWVLRVPTRGQLLYAPVAPAFRRRLRLAIASLRPDVLHLHLPNTSALWCLTLPAARRIPWVVHWHSDVVVSRQRRLLTLAYLAYRPLEQAVLARAECIVTTSAPYLDASEPLQRWRDKCMVVPLGLDLRRADAAPQATSPTPWPPGSLRLLSVGRLAHYKGFETLIEAVAGVPQAHLAIAGDGESRATLQRCITRLFPAGTPARVSLLGAVSEADKHALLRACDAFCLASRERTEAFGLAVLEAMQHGKPCLVSDLPGSGLPWLVRSSGAGRVVALDDVGAWRNAISELREDPGTAAAQGARGRQAVAERFHIDVSARDMQRVYRRAMAEDDAAVGASAPDAGALVVIPARDEAATVGEIVRALRELGWQNVLVVDDQSSDDTAAVARAAGARVLRPTLPLGAWGAMQTGVRYALRHGHAPVITLDADGQHEPACIPDLLAAARTHDVVIGAFPQRGTALRQFAWRYFRWLTGFALEDLTSGFRCYNRRACELLADQEATLLDYQDLGVLMLLRRGGMRIAEVPVAMYPRTSGGSRVYPGWWRVSRYMVESTLLCLARWHPRHHFK